ncbi:hypothetical protein SBA7_1650020 [Candidatus Sulfotelmatobacter sp. SbA7]|nr:hypothetical protein SBA7_1650020 [Candidatus Sulfotelmatobacter sp. SbA7]
MNANTFSQFILIQSYRLGLTLPTPALVIRSKRRTGASSLHNPSDGCPILSRFLRQGGDLPAPQPRSGGM